MSPCGWSSLISIVRFASFVMIPEMWPFFVAAKPFGILFYPVAFLGMLELPRYMYWTEGRAVPALIALGVVGVLMQRESAAAGSDPLDHGPRVAVSASGGLR